MVIRPFLDIGDTFENFGWPSVVSSLDEPPTTHHWFTNLKNKNLINQSEVSKPCLYPWGDSQNLNFSYWFVEMFVCGVWCGVVCVCVCVCVCV